MIFYSKSTNGFYDDEIHSLMPDDVVCISKEKHEELLLGQSSGKIISADKTGNPVLLDRVFSKEDDLKAKINELESKITNRRLRDAILTQEGDVWLSDIENEIAQLRAQL